MDEKIKRRRKHTMSSMSGRYLMFVAKYIETMDAGAAYLAAGFTGKGDPSRLGSRLLHTPSIKARIAQHMGTAMFRAEIKAERVVEELGRVAFLNPANLFDENGRLIPVKDLPPQVAAAVSSIEVRQIGGETTITNIKFVPKLGALELLSKYFGLLIERREETHVYKFDKMSDEEIAEVIHNAITLNDTGEGAQQIPPPDGATGALGGDPV